MPQHPKRPRDVNQLAKLIADIATGEAEDVPEPEKDVGHPKGSKSGGAAWAAKLTDDERSVIARMAAAAW